MIVLSYNDCATFRLLTLIELAALLAVTCHVSRQFQLVELHGWVEKGDAAD